MRAADGHFYVVKFQNNPQHLRVLANELIATRLAERVGLPVPAAEVIEVGQWLIQNTPDLSIESGVRPASCHIGLQFGARYVCDPAESQVFDYLPESMLDKVKNLGAFAGMLALAVTSFALIGKLFSEAIENIDAGPIEAVNATGANPLQMIVFAILPQITPPFISYLIYQWDINVRMATIIGFAGGGGIGLTLTTFFGSLQYHKAGTIVAFIVIVVALMDFASARLRQVLV